MSNRISSNSVILAALIPLIFVGLTLRVEAFPVRVGEDCFYGDGEPDGDGVATWMGCCVKFTPPYVPYTVDSISIYITRMLVASGVTKRLQVSVLDSDGVLRQTSDIDWGELSGREGWVLIDVADRTYGGPFYVVINSGVGLPSGIDRPADAVFMLGTDTADSATHSLVYTSQTPPPPPAGLATQAQLIQQGASNLQKLVAVTTGLPGYPGGNWMIRAHAPGLQMETTRISITMADIEALHFQPDLDAPPESRSWHMPPIGGFGPRGCVHCPTSLSGITFYYYESSKDRKFLVPHDQPWASPELINSLGLLCRDLAAEGVVGIEHIGIYNNRNIYGTNTKSSHAFGMGIDISGFQFSDGRVVMVEDHDDPAVRAVLERIRDNYLKKNFPTVLDWHYQRHNNHFHVNLPYNP